MMVVEVEAGETFKPGTPRTLFEMPQPERDLGDPSRYSVTPDGQRFLIVTTGQGEAGAGLTQIIVVQNWLQQLKPGVRRSSTVSAILKEDPTACAASSRRQKQATRTARAPARTATLVEARDSVAPWIAKHTGSVSTPRKPQRR